MLPERQASYRVHKISAALSTTVGFGVPAILDRWTASVYGIPACTYQLGRIDEGLRLGLALSDIAVGTLSEGLDEYREQMVSRSISEMGIALNEIGTPPVELRPDVLEEDSEDRQASTKMTLQKGPAQGRQIRRDDKEAFLAFVAAVLPSSYSQRMQDLWALWESGFPTTGYFAEFGALGGRDFSNTYVLEQLGWTGVIAEPHPRYADQMPANRTCAISTKCVLDRSGDIVEFHVVRGRPALSTVAGFGTDDDRSAVRENYETHHVETISLEDLLTESSAPDVIDYLSIDTEGSELVILGAYDFVKRPIRMISVEHNNTHRDELFEMLTGHGYKRRWPELSGHDDWYVLQDAFPNWSASTVPEFVLKVDHVKPFERELPVRRSLVNGLRTSSASPRDLLGLPRASHIPRSPSLDQLQSGRAFCVLRLHKAVTYWFGDSGWIAGPGI